MGRGIHNGRDNNKLVVPDCQLYPDAAEITVCQVFELTVVFRVLERGIGVEGLDHTVDRCIADIIFPERGVLLEQEVPYIRDSLQKDVGVVGYFSPGDGNDVA